MLTNRGMGHSLTPGFSPVFDVDGPRAVSTASSVREAAEAAESFIASDATGLKPGANERRFTLGLNLARQFIAALFLSAAIVLFTTESFAENASSPHAKVQPVGLD